MIKMKLYRVVNNDQLDNIRSWCMTPRHNAQIIEDLLGDLRITVYDAQGMPPVTGDFEQEFGSAVQELAWPK